MSKYILFFILTCFGFAVEPIVTTDWLHKNLNNKNLVIVQVSGKDAYGELHIPNATNTQIENWRMANGKFVVIKPKDVIENEIRKLGISKDSEVVLYAPIKNPKDLLTVSYIFWALNYHGVKNIGILDGGLGKWTKDGFAINNEPYTPAKSNYSSLLNPALIGDKTYVKSKLGKIPMVDARSSDNYLGITKTDGVARDGHIKGAMSYSWNYSIDKDYIIKDTKKLNELFTKGYRLDKNKELIVYCTGGLETSYNYYILSSVLGFKKVRLYDASMKEWGNEADTTMSQYKYEMFKS